MQNAATQQTKQTANNSYERWNEDEIHFLFTLFVKEGKSVEVIHLFYAELFQNRSRRAIRQKLHQLKFYEKRQHRLWSEGEDEILRSTYGCFTNGDLTAFFDARSSGAISQRAKKLGLRKNSMIMFANPDQKKLKKDFGTLEGIEDFLAVVKQRLIRWQTQETEQKPNTVH